MRGAALALMLLAGTAPPASAQEARGPSTVFLEDLTWTEARDRLQGGATTIILGTAGTEQKGPHMVLGEHKYVLQFTAERIARALGNTLVAPIITYVPEGSWDTPLRGHMAKAGTITLPEDRFVALMMHAAKSLRAGGFRTLLLIGDSGGNQRGMATVADSLNKLWAGTGARALFIGDYYTKSAEDIRTYLGKLGFPMEAIGSHAGMVDTSELLFVNPSLVRRERLAPNGGSADSGVNGDPTKATAELGKALVQIKIDNALAQIRNGMREGGANR